MGKLAIAILWQIINKNLIFKDKNVICNLNLVFRYIKV